MLKIVRLQRYEAVDTGILFLFEVENSPAPRHYEFRYGRHFRYGCSRQQPVSLGQPSVSLAAWRQFQTHMVGY